MANTRNRLRRRTDSFLGVYDRSSEELVGRLVDMTTDGVKLLSVSALEANAEFQFKMDLPVDIRGSKAITFDAVSIWSKQDSVSHEYYTGFQILGLSPKEKQKIELLIDGPLFSVDPERVHVTLSKKTN